MRSVEGERRIRHRDGGCAGALETGFQRERAAGRRGRSLPAAVGGEPGSVAAAPQRCRCSRLRIQPERHGDALSAVRSAARLADGHDHEPSDVRGSGQRGTCELHLPRNARRAHDEQSRLPNHLSHSAAGSGSAHHPAGNPLHTEAWQQEDDRCGVAIHDRRRERHEDVPLPVSTMTALR